METLGICLINFYKAPVIMLPKPLRDSTKEKRKKIILDKYSLSK